MWMYLSMPKQTGLLKRRAQEDEEPARVDEIVLENRKAKRLLLNGVLVLH